jgi:hypothetical protein
MPRKIAESGSWKAFVRLYAAAALALMVFNSVVVVSGASHSSLPEPSGQTPIWSINLHSFGFAEDQDWGFTLYRSRNRNPYSVSRFNSDAIAFTSTGQVGVAFGTISMIRFQGYVPGTGSTYLISFDSATGKVIATKQWHWPDTIANSSLAATASGKFLLQEDDGQLILYSPSLQVINSVQLKKLVEGRYLTFPSQVSTDGHYLFVQSEKDNIYRLSMLDVETLRPIRSWSFDFPILAGSDHYLARWQELKKVYKRSLYVQSNGTDWKEIYRDTGCNEMGGHGATFLTDSVLLVRSCNKLTEVDSDGNILFSNTFPPKHALETFGASADGQRFAISIAQLKKQPFWVGDPGYDRVHPTLIVYDAKSHQAVSTFTLNQKDERPSSFAFSADGSQLVLLRSGVLELYQIAGAH